MKKVKLDPVITSGLPEVLPLCIEGFYSECKHETGERGVCKHLVIREDGIQVCHSNKVIMEALEKALANKQVGGESYAYNKNK